MEQNKADISFFFHYRNYLKGIHNLWWFLSFLKISLQIFSTAQRKGNKIMYIFSSRNGNLKDMLMHKQSAQQKRTGLSAKNAFC